MSYPAINSTELGCVTIVHCPLDEHKGMVAKVKEGSNKIQQLQVSLEKEIEKHKECRSTLVNSAVTGKIKVC
jgi:type I restriction enzyme S subunit